MSTEPQRLYFGNPSKSIELKPMPNGQRQCFGEPPQKKTQAPTVPNNSRVLAYGNQPANAGPDAPIKILT